MANSRTSKSSQSTVIEIDPLPQDRGKLTLSEDTDAPIKTDANPQGPSRATASPRATGWILATGAIIALLWSAGAIAYVAGVVGVSNLQSLPAAQMAGLFFGALGPALFIIALSWAVREIITFGRATTQIQNMAERFADPAKFVQQDAKVMADAVSTQMSHMNASVEGALARLGAMEEVLEHHTRSFAKAENSARERTDNLINDLRREREAITELADQLDQKTADIAVTISEQSKMVVSAADIANAQSAESSKMLSEATIRLEKCSHNAATEAEKIGHRLEQASEKLDKTALSLTTSRQDIQASASSLDASQDKISEALDARKNEVMELLNTCNQCAEQLQSTSKESAMQISQTLEESLKQARHYTSIMREEGNTLAGEYQARAEELQNAAEQAKAALDTYADAITRRMEHANEASFTASSWADKTLEKLQEATNALDERLQSLPEAADASSQQVEAILRKRLQQLNEASLQAADEARSIDEAFQGRIRHNYELLSDFMLKMGATASPKAPEIELPNPLDLRAKTQADAPVAANLETGSAEPDPIVEPASSEQSGATEQSLKSTASEATLESLAELEEENRPAVPATKKEGWHWKDVLSRIDTPTSASSEKSNGKTDLTGPVDRLVAALRKLEIHPDNLFDATSYRAAALARISNGHRTMADVVRVDADDAINQLNKLFEQDPGLKQDAQDFIAELREKVDKAAKLGNQLHVETHLRTGDGPAYLLLEAALIEQT